VVLGVVGDGDGDGDEKLVHSSALLILIRRKAVAVAVAVAVADNAQVHDEAHVDSMPGLKTLVARHPLYYKSCNTNWRRRHAQHCSK